jgi:hypothetical protein
MDQKRVIAKLKAILNRADVESDGLVNRKRSPEHSSEIEVLLDHLSLLVADLRFNVVATRRELYEVRCLLEE